MHAASVRAARRGAHLRPCGAAPRRSSTTRRSARRVPCAARRRGEEAYEEAEDEEEDEATAALREKLMQQYDAAQEDPEREPLDGWALRELMQDKWGASYEVRIVRRSDPLGVKRFYCQVMWKYLEQQSFKMSEAQYMEQMDTVAALLEEWGQAEKFTKEIVATKKRPWMDTVGARAVSVVLPVSDEVEEVYGPLF